MTVLQIAIPGDGRRLLLCGVPGETALLWGDGGAPATLSCTLRGMSSAERVWGPPLLNVDLALLGEPLEDLGTGRLEWPALGVFFILEVVNAYITVIWKKKRNKLKFIPKKLK